MGKHKNCINLQNYSGRDYPTYGYIYTHNQKDNEDPDGSFKNITEKVRNGQCDINQ